MSLINKMLQDLDARGTTRAEGVPPEIKTVAAGERRLPVRRIAFVVGGVLLALGAAAWVVFPLKGKSYDVQPAPVAKAAPAAPVSVAEVAPAPAVREEKPAQRALEADTEAPPVAREKTTEPHKAGTAASRKEAAPEPAPALRVRPAPPAADPEPQSAGSTTSWAVASERARAEQARLDKRWKAEAARLAALPAPQRRAGERKLREEQARAASKAKAEATWLAALERKEAADGTAAAPAPAPAAAGRNQGRMETESQHAENAYRRGLAALQDGRVSEAMAGLQAALRVNPRHEAARQTLVGLLIENNRGDEAMTQLQQALTLDPRQPALAMLLARLQIERGKSGIEALLRTLPYAAGSGEYHAFLGGALQRQNRFHEAAEQYQTALRTTPNNAVWWMGLGMALQGEKRNAEAADAFRQAKALGTLSPDLQAFVERRLQQVAR
ncbi:tetratricopeptide repeat protein [Massilia litorea]|uniref:Tetratricopeptide repeat protein n=1 Tax=Massilia litorea TaxID=2769491 RepID=A0A7L9U2E8_9BURK|nr:tetratricopeptide repeat protein [Massilia litorea]QOL49097.1 tetratricopeptide repeat protein [Massilia litorea]